PNVHAPVLGLYGGTDARIALTVPGTDSAMKALGRTYSHTIFPGAAHGFLRAQTQEDGSIMQANLDATKQAWPATIAWFRKYLR
ncbi:MAG: dienelactone hydrolase family protein, partial [Sciscionella sp.]